MKEEIEWFDPLVCRPDADMTVMIETTESPEPVWLGYWNDEEQRWMDIEGFPVPFIIQRWAYMPLGAMVHMHAVVYANGLIEVRADVPDGAVSMCHGPREPLQAFLEVTSRHGKGAAKGRLIVPGVPEAESQGRAMDALLDHVTWLKKSAPPVIRFDRGA